MIAHLNLRGLDVPVLHEPGLEFEGLTRGGNPFGPPVTIHLREPGARDGRVLLHEILHALVKIDPARTVSADAEEMFVRHLTAGLHDDAGFRMTAATPSPESEAR